MFRRLLLLLTIVVESAAASANVDVSTARTAPAPSRLRAEIEISGRTATLRHVDVVRVTGDVAPRTFSDGLIGRSDGFSWYVSRHYALKTDIAPDNAADSLALLEMAWPLYNGVFGIAPPGSEFRRQAVVLASSRNALERAMIDDNMHVFNLGGITQEAFAAAYLYMGTAYQTRYILLHEGAHLFQYCISGDTRNCYGFFVEGVADYFSSHVYDSERSSLTVNVLDRAPIHNHLASGLEELKRLGNPSFSTLYNGCSESRGIDVIMTAFLQSTPEFEQKWHIYCENIVLNASSKDPKKVSDTLMNSLYGGAAALDDKFSQWLTTLQPSFCMLSREFDQDGDSFVSAFPATPAAPARLLLPPFGTRASEFICDWPHSPKKQIAPDGACFAVSFGVPKTPGEYAGFDIVSVAKNGLEVFGTCVLTNEFPGDDVTVVVQTNNAAQISVSMYKAGNVTDAALRTKTFSFAGKDGEFIKSLRPRLVASTPDVRFTTLQRAFSCASMHFQPCGVTTPASSRFNVSPALRRIYRASSILGDASPQSLIIARNSLLANSDSALVSHEDTLSVAFWETLAGAIVKSTAERKTKDEALVALAGIDISVAHINSGKLEATVSTDFPPASNIGFSWIYDGEIVHKDAKKPVYLHDVSICSAPINVSSAKLECTIDWLGHRIHRERLLQCGEPITEWNVLGPFEIPNGKFIETVFEPEKQSVDLLKVFMADDGSRITWRKVVCADGNAETPPLLHMAKIFGRQANNSVAYLVTEIESGSDRAAELIIGTSDAISVWNNDAPLLDDFRKREWSNCNVCVPLTLQKGKNVILFKLTHATGVWFFSAQLRKK